MIQSIVAFILLALAIGCYSVSQLALHSKLKWSKGDDSFWGEDSHYRKYANPLDAPKDNWYYKFFKIGYKERFLFSATFLVSLTDGMHLCQAGFLLFLSLGISLALALGNWWGYLAVYIGVHVVHFVTYKLLSK